MRFHQADDTELKLALQLHPAIERAKEEDNKAVCKNLHWKQLTQTIFLIKT
jgi:hypothetical protein